MENLINSQLTSKLFELEARAKRIGYKNVIPRLPKKPTQSTLSGFNKRLNNWVNQLETLEKECVSPTITQTTNVLRSFLKR